MSESIIQIEANQLHRYAQVSIAFQVESQLRLEAIEHGLGGLRLVLEPVTPTYTKDYDVEESPTDWPLKFDTSHWAFFLAMDGMQPVGAATVALNSPDVHLLENRSDLAVLWDLRVQTGWRGQGVGHRLFWQAADWARQHNCHQLKIETQNINVPACRFYTRQGCELGGIHRFGYAAQPHVAHEVMLLWYLNL